jgi:hypothetical protein
VPKYRVDHQPPQKLPPRFLTVGKYCELTGECAATAYNGMRTGRIPFIDDDGRRKIPASYVDERERLAYERRAQLLALHNPMKTTA